MKKVSQILLFLVLPLWSWAQDYSQAMERAFTFWEQGQTEQSVALFEQIAQVEKEKWLPAYYAANVDIVQVFNGEAAENWKFFLQRAAANLENAYERSPYNSEIMTMEGLLYTAYVAQEPSVYGMKYSGKIYGLHHKAIALDSLNPRAQMNLIEYEMGYARFMEEDLTPYCEKMKTIMPYFDTQTAEVEFAPDYGKERALQIIKNCESK